MKTFETVLCLALLAAGASGADPAAPPPPAPLPPKPPEIELELIERGKPAAARPEQAWLGVGTEEAGEALAAQLNLPAGGGLVVSYVTPESPAAKAGIQKNDVLATLDAHLLVHPAQLRKLIQSHRPADEVTVGYFQAGKSNSVRIALGKAPAFSALTPPEAFWSGEFPNLGRELRPMGEEIRKRMEEVRRSLRESGLDREKLEREIRRGVEEARRGIEEAMRASSNAAAQVMQELKSRPFELGSNSSVVVRKESREHKTLVKTDDEGTVTIIADPRKRATVLDPAGKVLFEGEIETPEQLENLPSEIRERLQPLLKQLDRGAPPPPEPLRSPKEEARGLPGSGQPEKRHSFEPGLSAGFRVVLA